MDGRAALAVTAGVCHDETDETVVGFTLYLRSLHMSFNIIYIVEYIRGEFGSKHEDTKNQNSVDTLVQAKDP